MLHLAPDLVSKLAVLPVLPVARPVQQPCDFNELTRSQLLGPLLRPVERQLLPPRELVATIPRLDHAPRQRQRLAVEELPNPLLVPPEDREGEGLQPVPDRLPPLLEDARHHAPQVCRAHAAEPSPQPRRSEEVQTDQSRVHLRLGVEHRRRDFEVYAAVRVQLKHDAEYSVLLRRRVGDYPAPHLPLHGDRGAPYRIGVTRVGEREEDLGRDVVREVPDDGQRPALRRREGGVVDLEDVLVPHAQLGVLAVEQLDGPAVDLDALEVVRSQGREEDVRQRAGPGPELDGPQLRLPQVLRLPVRFAALRRRLPIRRPVEQRRRGVAYERFHDLRDGVPVPEVVLAQALLRPELSRGQCRRGLGADRVGREDRLPLAGGGRRRRRVVLPPGPLAVRALDPAAERRARPPPASRSPPVRRGAAGPSPAVVWLVSVPSAIIMMMST